MMKNDNYQTELNFIYYYSWHIFLLFCIFIIINIVFSPPALLKFTVHREKNINLEYGLV